MRLLRRLCCWRVGGTGSGEVCGGGGVDGGGGGGGGGGGRETHKKLLRTKIFNCPKFAITL